MKKYLFLIVMLCTSVSAFSQNQNPEYTERTINVDIVANVPNVGFRMWMKNEPMIIREYPTPRTEIHLNIGFHTFVATVPGRNIPFKECVRAMIKEINPFIPYFLNGYGEVYIVRAGHLSFPNL